jgi:conjugal transfer/entry exclusion protein
MSSYNLYPITAEERFEQQRGEFTAAFNKESLEEALSCVQEMCLLIHYIRPVAEETDPGMNRLWNDFANYTENISSVTQIAVDLTQVANNLKKCTIELVKENDKQNCDLLQEEVQRVDSAVIAARKSILKCLNQLSEKKSEIKEMSKKMSEQPQC